jgi:hypothetical protein
MKQRWRFTKTPLKKWTCDTCFKPVKVVQNYEPEMCCDGIECGCYGNPLNPVFCNDCEKLFMESGYGQ